MNTDERDIPCLGADFFENRAKFPQEELARYEGQYVAWSWDGTRIVAFGPEREEVWRRLDEAGIPLSQVVLSYVDPGDTVYL